jgi:hypothetical protein
LWWGIGPAYAWGIGHLCAVTLKYGFGYPIDGVTVNVRGVLNTETELGYIIGARRPAIPIVPLISNVAAYVALMLATSGLGWRRLLARTCLGVFILALTHWVYLIVFFVWEAAIARDQTVFIAIGQLFITLPFVLWIVLAFWAQSPQPASTTRSADGPASP